MGEPELELSVGEALSEAAEAWRRGVELEKESEAIEEAKVGSSRDRHYAVLKLARALKMVGGASVVLVETDADGAPKGCWRLSAGQDDMVTGKPRDFSFTPEGFMVVRAEEVPE